MMKLIIVLGIEEFQDEINSVFKKINVPMFSKVGIEGYKTEDDEVDMSNWFGQDLDSDFSVMFFAFVPASKANVLMKAIAELNVSLKRIRPFHAFQMPVEKVV